LELLTTDRAGETFNSPRYRWLGPPQWQFEVTGQIVLANATDVTNKILLFFGRTEAGTELDLVELAKRNIAGIVVHAGSSPVDIPGLLNYVWDGLNHSSVILPVVQVSSVVYPVLEDLIVNNENVTIKFDANGVNEWALAFESGWMIFYSVFLSALSVACMAMALYKYIAFVRFKGFQTSVPQLMLIFEFLANALRLVHTAIDPLQSRTIMTYFETQMFYTISWPFFIINLLLVSFYWHELMRKSKVQIHTFLRKLLTPFWIIFAVLFAGEITSGVLRGLQFNTRIVVLTLGIIYILIALACVIFFFVTGHRLARELKRIAKKYTASKRRTQLNKTALYVYISTGGVLAWLICLVAGGLTDVFWFPWGFFSVWFVTFFSLSFISLMHMLALHEPTTSQSTRSGSSQMRTPGQTASAMQKIQSEDQIL
jgi:hypothetical protein